MQISSTTVETYRSPVKEKLHLDSVNEVIHHATQWLLDKKGK